MCACAYMYVRRHTHTHTYTYTCLCIVAYSCIYYINMHTERVAYLYVSLHMYVCVSDLVVDLLIHVFFLSIGCSFPPDTSCNIRLILLQQKSGRVSSGVPCRADQVLFDFALCMVV